MTDSSYTPIDCGLHDQLQLLAMRRRKVTLVARDDRGDPLSMEGRVTDVLSRGGAEWLALEDGTFLRLDRLVTIDGQSFTPGG